MSMRKTINVKMLKSGIYDNGDIPYHDHDDDDGDDADEIPESNDGVQARQFSLAKSSTFS